MKKTRKQFIRTLSKHPQGITEDSRSEKISTISYHFSEIMKTMGLDLRDASLKDTPDRVAKMFINETCASLFNAPPKITTFPNNGYDQMVIEKDITVYSLCEHHWQLIKGKCHIAYIPKEEVVGLSKLNRVVQYFSAKPQLQERLTNEIGNFLSDVLKTDDVAVVVDAVHNCVAARGCRDINSSTVTSYLGGNFRTTEVRSEFLNLIK